MDQELVSLLQSPDRETAAKGAEMLASFLSKASFPSKSVQALREVIPVQPFQRILSALSQRLTVAEAEEEVSDSLSALLHLLQNEDVRDAVINGCDAGLVELCRDLISGLAKAVRLANISVGLMAVAVFDAVCQSEKARQLLLQHSDTEPIFERIPQLLADMPEHTSIPLSVAHLTRYPSAQRRVLASGRCATLLAGLNQLMLCSDARIASDAACAVGNIAFNNEGRYQVLAYKSLDEVVAGLLHVLNAPEDLAGNAAWALGNLCRDKQWCSRMLDKADFVEDVVKGLANLMSTADLQTHCDWMCAIAMITVIEEGQKQVLAHVDSELLLVNLLRNVASKDSRVQSAACVTLCNLKETPLGKARYENSVALLSLDGRVCTIETINAIIESADFDDGVNAAIAMRGLPSTACTPRVASDGKRGYGIGKVSPIGGECSIPVRQDLVCIKSLDGAVLRSLPISLFTAGSVVPDPHLSELHSLTLGQACEPAAQQECTSKKIGEHVANGDAGGSPGMGAAAASAGGRSLVGGVEEEGSKAAVDGGEGKQAPAGHAVKEVQLESCDETSLSVSWEPVFPESTDSCRFVCDGGNGGSYRNVATVTREEVSQDGKYCCRISGLLPGREYRVLAIARTRFKPCHGAQTMFDTKAVMRTRAAAPAAPDKCVLSSRTRTSLKIRWVTPDGSGLGIDAYEVAWCKASLEEEAAGVQSGGEGEGGESGYKVNGEWEVVKETLSAKDTSWQLKKLGPGQHYGFRVRAINAQGPGLWSPDVFYSTAASVPSAPEYIKNVSNHNDPAIAGKLALEWDKPNSNGAAIEAYILEHQDVVRGGAFEVVYNGPETRFLVSGLMAGSTYRFRVKASNNVGAGEYSPALEATGAAAVPAACDAPVLVKAKASSLSMKWSEPDCRGSEIRTYRVMLAEAGSESAPSKKTKFAKAWQGSERACELCSGLSAGRRFFVRVVAINAIGESESSAVATFETTPDAPDAPQGLVLVSKGHLTAKLRWKCPQQSNGCAVTGYRVEVENLVDNAVRTININTQTCEYEISDLQPERSYVVRVRAVNKVGTSSFSEPLRITPALPPPGPPGAPRLISAKSHSMSIRWDPPTGSVVVDGYRVEVLPDGVEQIGKFVGHDVHAHSHKADECRTDLPGLRPGVSYKVRVQARNKSGFGEKGPAAVLRTEAVTPAPTNLQTQLVEGDNNSLVALCSWDRPDGAVGVGQVTYHVEIDDGGEGSADFKQVYMGTKASFSHTLQTGKSYKFRVRAVSSLGSSAWSVIKGFSRSLPGQCMPEGVAVRLLEDGRTAALVWTPSMTANVSAYQVRVDLQEGKKRRVDEGLEYRRDDLSEGVHRFQVRAMVNGKWSEWSKEVVLTIPPSVSAHHLKQSQRPVAAGTVSDEAALGMTMPMEQRCGNMTGAMSGDGVHLGQEMDPMPWPGQGISLLHGVGEVNDAVSSGVPVGAVGASCLTASGDSFGASSPVVGVGGELGLFGDVGLKQGAVDRMFGIGSGGGQMLHLRTSMSLYGKELPAASDNMHTPMRLTQDMYSGESASHGIPMVSSGNWGVQVAQVQPEIPQKPGNGLSAGSLPAQMRAFSSSDERDGELLGRSELGGLLGEEEGDELMSSIPTGLLDEDFGNGMMDDDLGFYSMSSRQPGDSSTSRFSLWGMPLDAQAPVSPDISRTFSDELPPVHLGSAALASGVGVGAVLYDSDVSAPPVATAPHFAAGLPRNLHAGAGQLGGGGGGDGMRTVGRGIGMSMSGSGGQASGHSTPMGEDVMTSSFSGFEEDFDPMLSWPSQIGWGGVGVSGAMGMSDVGFEGVGYEGGIPLEPLEPVLGSEQSDGGNGIREQADPLQDLVRDLVADSCFTSADIDQKHREMMTSFLQEWPQEAHLLIEAARQPLLAADKNVILREQQGAFIHQALLKAKQHVKRQLSAQKVGPLPPMSAGEQVITSSAKRMMTEFGAGRGVKVDLKGELAQTPLRQALHELCQGTCVDMSDVDKQHVSMLQGLPPQDIMTMVRIAKSKLARIPRGETRSPAGLLHSVLSSAKDDLKRGKREGTLSSVSQHGGGVAGAGGGGGVVGAGQVQRNGVSGCGGAVAGPVSANGGAGSLADLPASVRRLVKELVSQTCFEDHDFERAHVSLLAGMSPAMAAFVLRNVRTRMAKTKRRDHRSPPLFLLGALQTATRNAQLQQGGGVGSVGGPAQGGEQPQDINAQMVERLREQIRGLGATPDL